VRKYVTCPKCGFRNDRTGGRRKCSNCLSQLPKRRVPIHARTLRDDSYERYCEISSHIHGTEPESCCVCGRPRPENRRHDRDHDHRTGYPRGLACVRCNRELLRNSTLEEARLVVAYLERVESYYQAVSA
jgi:Recombination endonuclease VII